MATLITNDGIRRVDDNYLMHWAKGSEAKNHKWIKRIWTDKGWKYQYKQASDKAKSLGNKISVRDDSIKSNLPWISDDNKKYSEYTAKARIYKKAADRDLERHNRIGKNARLADEYSKKSKQYEEYIKSDANYQNALNKEKEDAKRQQASAIGAANRAKSKSVKSKAKKVIRKVSNAIKNPVTTTGTITTSDNKKITKTIKKKKRNNLSGGTFKDFETRKKLRIN